ncbi:DUF7344 domain-containing protein [Natronococcus wangiae]|uniref:DUF7344 domain-containing protein n=1 Tax=Natronococcus wangiae TaxID=3068275 RepID=UPI00273F200C|nr:hypothetical protein [Natronococcus sp. AD5]
MGKSITQHDSSIQYDSASWLVTFVGVLLGASGLAYVMTHPEPLTVWTTELALVSLPAAAIVYGGYWIAASQMSKEKEWNIAKWCLIGAVVAAVLLFGYSSAERFGGATVIDPWLLIILGALGGGFVALFSAISTERQYLTAAIGTGQERRLIEEGVEPLSAEAQTFAELAADTRSWYVVWALQLAENPLGIETIAEQIAANEGTDTQNVYVDLIHVRLPKLADEGLIRYHEDVETVELSSERAVAVANASKELSATGEQLASAE